MRCVRISVAGLCLVLTPCTSGGSGPAAKPTSTARTPGSPASTPAGSPSQVPPGPAWSTYHGDNARTGLTQTPALEPPLRRAWTRELDGAVYAQPIVVGGTVIAATENNSVYALHADTGTTIWRRHLGDPVPLDQLPCGNINPLGITGTPAYDVRTGTVFVVTETAGGSHDLHAIDARRGTVRWTRNLDVVDRDRRAQQQRGALLVSPGRVYVAFGGLFGDCGNYIGYVTGTAADGKGAVAHYEVPSGREAGIWAAAGPVEDPATGDVLVAVGNGSGTGGTFDGSDSVLRLSPALQRRALFAPSTWPRTTPRISTSGRCHPSSSATASSSPASAGPFSYCHATSVASAASWTRSRAARASVAPPRSGMSSSCPAATGSAG